MTLITRKIGSKRQTGQIALRPRCPKCEKAKYKKDFRSKSGKPSPICNECRKQFPNAERDFFGVKPKEEGFEKHRIGVFTILKNQKFKKKEVTKLASAKARTYADKLTQMPGKIATILGKTFVVRGDDATLSDDEALVRIRDLIDDFEPNLIAQNKNKRLP